MAVVGAIRDETLEPFVALAASGDEVAFARIVETYHRDMRRVAYVTCGDVQMAEDAVAEAWSIAWRKLGTLRDPTRLRPWLMSVAANEARQLVRRQHRQSVHEIPIESSTGLVGPDSESDLDLGRALERMSAEDRALLSLRYVAGLNSSELARATGRSASGTRVRLGRLLERLRRELADVAVEP